MDHDLSSAGMALVAPNGSRVRLWAELNMLINDGGAHKLIWSCKGDAGTKLCAICRKLVSAPSGICNADGEDLLVCSLLHEHQLQFATDAEVRGSIDRLKRFKLTDNPPNFKLRQQAIGFTYTEHGLLFDVALDEIVKPTSQYCHDWMHGIFQGGVFNVLAFCLMRSAQAQAPNLWKALDDYLQPWHWPGALGYNASKDRPFSPDRVNTYIASKLVKCPASEGLSLLPILCVFADEVVRRLPGMDAACNALLALGDLVGALQVAVFGLVTGQYVRSCVRTMFENCERAGWEERAIPKFHWCIHFAQSIDKWGFSPTCWVHERKHKFAKKYANAVYKTGIFPTSAPPRNTSTATAQCV